MREEDHPPTLPPDAKHERGRTRERRKWRRVVLHSHRTRNTNQGDANEGGRDYAPIRCETRTREGALHSHQTRNTNEREGPCPHRMQNAKANAGGAFYALIRGKARMRVVGHPFCQRAYASTPSLRSPCLLTTNRCPFPSSRTLASAAISLLVGAT